MRQQGFTLIELIVVVTVIAVLAAALAFEFGGWKERYTSESEIKTMHNDLLTARTYAMSQNVSYFVQLSDATPQEYTIYADKEPFDDVLNIATDTKIESLSRKGLTKKLKCNSGVNPTTIRMDRRGMVEAPSTSPAGTSIWMLKDGINPYGFLDEPARTKPELEYDCIVLGGTRILVGKYNDAKDPVCQPK
jgi:prepilin-type N-terminal cleavage/methylation domain-containing protein